MICPKCKSNSTKVIDSRMYPGGLNVRWRKHECDDCKYRFYTEEKVIKDMNSSIQFDRIAYKKAHKRE